MQEVVQINFPICLGVSRKWKVFSRLFPCYSHFQTLLVDSPSVGLKLFLVP